jgi:hypothetical protein
MALMNQLHIEKDYSESIGGVCMGLPGSRFIGSTVTTSVTAADAKHGVEVYQSDVYSPTITAATGTRTYCLPLVGLLGSVSKYVPLHKIGQGGNGLLLRITLADPNMVLKTTLGMNGWTYDNQEADITTAKAFTYTAANFAIWGQCVQFSDIFNNMFDQVMMAGGVTLDYQTVVHQRYPIAVNSQSLSIPIAGRYKSIKSVFAVFRTTAALTSDTPEVTKISTRTHNQITKYQWRIGDSLYPAQKVNTDARDSSQALWELLKAAGYSCGKLGARGSGISNSNYYINDFTASVRSQDAGTVNALVTKPGFGCRYAIGLDLESFVGEKLESGLNTSDFGTQMYLDLESTNTYASVCDIYLIVDSLYHVGPEGISVSK